jgi:hypothetical protein
MAHSLSKMLRCPLCTKEDTKNNLAIHTRKTKAKSKADKAASTDGNPAKAGAATGATGGETTTQSNKTGTLPLSTDDADSTRAKTKAQSKADKAASTDGNPAKAGAATGATGGETTTQSNKTETLPLSTDDADATLASLAKMTVAIRLDGRALVGITQGPSLSGCSASQWPFSARSQTVAASSSTSQCAPSGPQL